MRTSPSSSRRINRLLYPLLKCPFFHKTDILIRGAEPGLTYHGKIKSIQKYGACIEFLSGIDGLLHINQISDDPMTEDQPKERLPIGEKIYVKLTQIKKDTNKISRESID